MKLDSLGHCFHSLFLGCLAAFFCFQELSSAKAAPPSLNEVDFDHLEGDQVFFKGPPGVSIPKPFKTGLFDLGYLGVLRPDEGLPYFLFVGRKCEKCLEDQGIFSIRPGDSKSTQFIYPGKILEAKSKTLVFESRAFYGKCLHNRGDVYVAFQKERVDRKRHMQPSVVVAEAEKYYFQENLIERHFPLLQNTLRYVKKKTCHEIEGRKRLVDNKLLDLHPQSGLDVDDDDHEDE